MLNYVQTWQLSAVSLMLTWPFISLKHLGLEHFVASELQSLRFHRNLKRAMRLRL